MEVSRAVQENMKVVLSPVYLRLTNLESMLRLLNVLAQELMSAAKRREGASNYRTLFVPTSVESRTLNFG